MSTLEFINTAPLTTVQDGGRPGMLRHGVAGSGPMDRGAYHRAGLLLGVAAAGCIEFGAGQTVFRVTGGPLRAAFCGGDFGIRIGEDAKTWESLVELTDGDTVTVTPGTWGNWGLLRFDHEIDVPLILGSRSTNLIAGLGGFHRRCLRSGDELRLAQVGGVLANHSASAIGYPDDPEIRVIWGIHADLFSTETRAAFLVQPFTVSPKIDRMGLQLLDARGVFAGPQHLSLVSDVVAPGDIQILGDGTPVVLMRDHQPTGGYPRIATVIGQDIDRLAQTRPGSEVRFRSVTVDKAQAMMRASGLK